MLAKLKGIAVHGRFHFNFSALRVELLDFVLTFDKMKTVLVVLIEVLVDELKRVLQKRFGFMEVV